MSLFLKMVNGFLYGFNRFITICNATSTVMIFLLMALISTDVIGRYIFNRPMPGTYEIGEASIIFIAFLAFAYTQSKRGHIQIEMLTAHISYPRRYISHIVVSVAGIFFCSMLFWETWHWAMISWNVREALDGPLRLPLYPAKFMMPLGSLMLTIEFMVELGRSIRGLIMKTGGDTWIL